VFRGFGASSLDFELRFWTGKFEAWPIVQSEVTVALNGALAQAGIEIPFPQQDLRLRSVDPLAGRALGLERRPAPALESDGEEH
jgi:small-conductance mechanosensitive channel